MSKWRCRYCEILLPLPFARIRADMGYGQVQLSLHLLYAS